MGGTNRGTIAQVPHGAVRRRRRSTPCPSPRALRNAIMPGRWGRTERQPARRSHANEKDSRRTYCRRGCSPARSSPSRSSTRRSPRPRTRSAKGKPDEAVKTMTKAAADAGPEGQVALARLQERVGNLDAPARRPPRTTRRRPPVRATRTCLAAVAQLHARRRQGAGRARPREAGRRGRRDAGGARRVARAGADRGRARCGASADKAVAAGATNATAHLAAAKPWNASGVGV